jgi:hypothetical protein
MIHLAKNIAVQEAIRILDEYAKTASDTNGKLGDFEFGNRGEILFQGKQVDTTDTGYKQLCQRLDVPSDYMKRLPGDLRKLNFDHAMSVSRQEQSILTRFHDDTLRGIVTDRYNLFDNTPLFRTVHEVMGDAQVRSFHHTDDHVISRLIIGEPVDIGTMSGGCPDVHYAALHISNSEVGTGSIIVLPTIYRQVCTNGLSYREDITQPFRVTHIQRESEIAPLVAEAMEVAQKKSGEMFAALLNAKKTRITDVNAILRKIGEKERFPKKFLLALEEAAKTNVADTGSNLFSVVQTLTETVRDEQDINKRLRIERIAAKLLAA